MSEYTKADLDAMADRVARVIRDAPFPAGSPQAQYAEKIAELLGTQFPDSPDLPRITLACAHYMAAIGAEGIGSATLVRVLGEAALRLAGPLAELATALGTDPAVSGHDGHQCPAGAPDCGYVGGGDSDEDVRADWEHAYWEHKPCTECPAVPRDGDSLTHSSSCPRLKPGYAYPPVSTS